MASKVRHDLQISQAATLKPITEIAAEIGLLAVEIEQYGPFKGKVPLGTCQRMESKPQGKLILVSAMTPTPAGEGKTTTTIGLADALRQRGEKAMVCLREPSMGPVFGVKGGACGGGQSQVVPMEDINLHFTGDMHAVTTAHNLLVTLVDNHLHQGNALRIDPRRIAIRRVMDMNDRSLRDVVIGLGGAQNGLPRETGFDITASSEVMAVLCLSESLQQLKEKLGQILVGFNYDDVPVFARDLQAHGAMAVVLKDAIKPNLVQTMAGTPAFIHGGPFANIAHGCNSLVATKLALRLSDIVVTEAGFATELGAEKFFDIKCRLGNLTPDVAVIVATARALKYHGGVPKAELGQERLFELARGFDNLAKHIENIKLFGIPCVVAVNRFAGDTDAEISAMVKAIKAAGARVAVSEVYEKGAEGGLDLAHEVLELLNTGTKEFDFLYPLELPLEEKMNLISRCCYGAKGVELLKPAKEKIALFEKLGYRKVPVCIAKTQSSLSDNPALLGRPQNFKITIKDVKLMSGAGFVVAIAGEIMTMPGLPKIPQAEKIDIDESGRIVGLF